MYRKTYVEINIDNINSNVKNIINYYKDYKYYIAVVKGNCYGHGLYIINEIINNGVNYLAVSSLKEALEIRKINKEIPILALEPISLDYLDLCIENDITLTIHDYYYALDLLKKSFGKLKVHLKIDSGMNRLGLKNKKEINEVYSKLKEKNNILLEGIYTHFATLGIYDKDYDNQLSKFIELTSDINLEEIPIVHLSKSAAFLDHEKIPFETGIRMGIAMYGYDPNPVFNENGIKNKLRKRKREWYKKKNNISKTINIAPIKLKPAFSLYSELIQIKEVKAGEFVGYGAMYRALKDTRIGIMPIGYDDGIFKRSIGRTVVINKNRYKIIGEIGMGMCAVEIDSKVKISDKVMFIGNDLPIKESSRYLRTSIYETMCNIKPSIPRIYLKDGKVVAEEEK